MITERIFDELEENKVSRKLTALCVALSFTKLLLIREFECTCTFQFFVASVAWSCNIYSVLKGT